MISNFLASQKLRYLAAGAWNTAFGYLCGVSLYFLLSGKFHIVIISIISNFMAISMSFLSYKVFVFKTRGKWLVEYCKCFLVYGGSAILSIALLWVFVDKMTINILIAQALVIIVTVAISYVGHLKFTFR